MRVFERKDLETSVQNRHPRRATSSQSPLANQGEGWLRLMPHWEAVEHPPRFLAAARRLASR